MLKTNTNKVIENTWAHICEHLESEMEEEQTSAEKILLRYFRCVGGATAYHKAYHLVEAGIFDIYYTDVRETLKNILEETDEEANQFDNQQVWELYCHLVAKTIDKKTEKYFKK